jgi:hypothetical protein
MISLSDGCCRPAAISEEGQTMSTLDRLDMFGQRPNGASHAIPSCTRPR